MHMPCLYFYNKSPKGRCGCWTNFADAVKVAPVMPIVSTSLRQVRREICWISCGRFHALRAKEEEVKAPVSEASCVVCVGVLLGLHTRFVRACDRFLVAQIGVMPRNACRLRCFPRH